MNYTHVYIIYKFEDKRLLNSQILDMLECENDALALFILKSKENYQLVKRIMSEYNYPYKIIRGLKDIESAIKDVASPMIIHARSVIPFVLMLIGIKRKKHIKKSTLLLDLRGDIIAEMDYKYSFYKNKSMISNLQHKIKRFILKIFLRRALSKTDAISYVSGTLKKTIELNYPVSAKKKSIIIPTCIKKTKIKNLSIPPLKLYPESIYVIYAGGTKRPWHQIDRVINLMSEIKKKYGRKVVCILSVDDIQTIKEKIHQHELDAIVINLPHKDVISLLRYTDYGIILRDDSLVNRVAAPTKLSEYIATNNGIIYSGQIGSLRDTFFLDIETKLVHEDSVLNKKYELKKLDKYKNSMTELQQYFIWEYNVHKYKQLLN